MSCRRETSKNWKITEALNVFFFVVFFLGLVWLMLGLQCSGSSGGADEEANRRPRDAESTEPGGLRR